MNFNEELKQRVEQINALLAAKLPAEEGMQQRVAEAMNYSVNAGGKRLLPDASFGGVQTAWRER